MNTKTGRFKSSAPNIQERLKPTNRMFIPSKEEQIVSMDFSEGKTKFPAKLADKK